MMETKRKVIFIPSKIIVGNLTPKTDFEILNLETLAWDSSFANYLLGINVRNTVAGKHSKKTFHPQLQNK